MRGRETESTNAAPSRPADAPRAGETPGVRCVLLHPKPAAPGEDPVPADLRASLERRGVRPTPCDSAFGALAEILAGATGGAPAGALLIVEPSRACPGDARARLLDAIETFAPGLSLWQYEADASPQMRALPPRAPRAEPPEPAARRASAPGAARPALRLTPGAPASNGEQPPPAAPAPSPATGHDAPRIASILSDEELSMLLGDEPPNNGAGHRPPNGGAS